MYFSIFVTLITENLFFLALHFPPYLNSIVLLILVIWFCRYFNFSLFLIGFSYLLN